MKNNISKFQKKFVLAITLGLVSGISQGANFDMQSQDLLTPSAVDDLIPSDSPFDEEVTSFFDFLPDSERQNLNKTYQNVLELIKKKKLDEAQIQINELLKNFSGEPELYNLQALVKIHQNNEKDAILSFQQAFKLNPNNLNALLGLTFLAIEKNELAEAQEFIDKAMAVNVRAVVPYILKANIAYRQNNLTEVENILTAGLNKVQGDKKLELRIVDNLIKLHELKQQPAKILELIQAVAKRYPNDKQVLSQLAKAQIINQQIDGGEQTLKKIIAQDQQDVVHRLLLARILMERPEVSADVANLIEEVADLSPDSLQVLGLQTIFLIKERKFEQALAQADRLDKKFPESAVGNMLKADIYLAQQQLDKALEYNQRAYEIKPNARLLNQIGGLLAAQGKTDEAIQMFSSELDKNPKNLDVHLQIANLYLGRKDYAKAESHYQTILNDKPENVVILNNLAMIYHDQNNPKALGLAKKAFGLSPDSAAIADTYGIVLLQNGQAKDALAKLQKAADLAPNSLDIQFHLAKAQQANGNRQVAIEILQKIANAPASFENKQAASELLKELSGR